MLQSAEEAEAYLESGPSLLGPGWREVAAFEDLSDEDEYTTDEEVSSRTRTGSKELMRIGDLRCA
jgi:hypothetical protein